MRYAAACLWVFAAVSGSLPPVPADAESSHPVYVDTAPDPAATLNFRAVQRFSLPAVDPDEGRNMAAAWGRWRQQVDAMMQERFAKNADAMFKDNFHLVAKYQYVVTKDGRIGNVHLLERSVDRRYDLWVAATTIFKAAHDPVLEFPKGTMRELVENTGVFAYSQEKLTPNLDGQAKPRDIFDHGRNNVFDARQSF